MEGAGLEVVPVAVDADGLQVSALAPSRAETVLVTPAHQFPTGVLMSPSRRSQLISWVDESDRYVLEDDYDAEFRFAGSPVGAIQGLRPDRVVYIGSTSKALSPALRIGWVIVPQDLHDDVVRLKRYADLGSPTVPQLALADLIDSGDYDRHLRRVRQLYGKRRRAVVRAVERGFPGADVLGIEAGLHVAIRVEALDERRFQQLAEQQASVAIGVLGEHAIKFQPASALLLGFAAETENRLQVAVNRLAKLL
jgi:GntR family transcriptional regulator/MocR family aminotransferase